MTDEAQMKIFLHPELKERFEAIYTSRGMLQKAAMARLIGWFCEQPEIVQALILGQIPETVQGPAARIAMEMLVIRDKHAQRAERKKS